MKMIDVLSLMAEGKIKKNTTLIVPCGVGEYEYKYRKIYRTFVDENLDGLDKEFILDESFLNREVHLEQPSEQKYRIKLPNTEFYVCLAKNENNEKEIIPYTKNVLMELSVKAEFTEQDFEEIEELKPYEQFKELVKDDN